MSSPALCLAHLSALSRFCHWGHNRRDNSSNTGQQVQKRGCNPFLLTFVIFAQCFEEMSAALSICMCMCQKRREAVHWPYKLFSLDRKERKPFIIPPAFLFLNASPLACPILPLSSCSSHFPHSLHPTLQPCTPACSSTSPFLLQWGLCLIVVQHLAGKPPSAQEAGVCLPVSAGQTGMPRKEED